MLKRRLFIIILAVVAAVCTMAACSQDGLTPDDLLQSGYVNIVTIHFNGGTANRPGSNPNEAHLYVKDNALISYSGLQKNGIIPSRAQYRLMGFARGEMKDSGDVVFNTGSDGSIVFWDFENDRVTESFTLYAVWAHNFAVEIRTPDDKVNATYNVKESQPTITSTVLINSLRVEAGYTFLNKFYYDVNCTQPVEFPYTHSLDSDNPVEIIYASRIEGTYTLVSEPAEFRRAMNNGTGIYLLNDIDFTGDERPLNVANVYNASIRGNGYTVKNFSVNISGAGALPARFGIFKQIGASTEMSRITFENVKVTAENTGNPSYVYIGLFAGEIAEGATFEEVEVKNVTFTYSLPNINANKPVEIGALCGNQAILSTPFTGITVSGTINGQNYLYPQEAVK